jgi:hypothetical protein
VRHDFLVVGSPANDSLDRKKGRMANQRRRTNLGRPSAANGHSSKLAELSAAVQELKDVVAKNTSELHIQFQRIAQMQSELDTIRKASSGMAVEGRFELPKTPSESRAAVSGSFPGKRVRNTPRRKAARRRTKAE